MFNRTVYGSPSHDSGSGTVAAPRRALWGIGVLVPFLSIIGQPAFAQAMYRIKPLVFPGGCTMSVPGGLFPEAYSLNDAGQVTGGACDPQGTEHAFVRAPNGTSIRNLGPLELGATSVGLALSPNGKVAGKASDHTGKFAFLWPGVGQGVSHDLNRVYGGLGGDSVTINGVNNKGQFVGSATLPGNGGEHAFVWLNNGNALQDLGTFGGTLSFALGIAADGTVAGNAYFSGDQDVQGFVWRNNGRGLRPLGALGGDFSFVTAVSATGHVVGGSNTQVGGKAHAFYRDNYSTGIEDLGTLNGDYSYAFAVNDLGQVAGQANLSPGKNSTHAFVWMNDGTPMRDIGSLHGAATNPHSINSLAQVTGDATTPGNTGQHAFLWRNDGTPMQDVNDLIDPLDPLQPYVVLSQAPVINARGEILAYGTDSRTGQFAAYLLQGTVLLLTPRSLDFGTQAIGTTSAARPVTVTNTSPRAAAIASITLSGPAAGQFAYTHDCGSSLAGHASCTINVSFAPSANGASTAVLRVNGGGGGLRAVALAGTGT